MTITFFPGSAAEGKLLSHTSFGSDSPARSTIATANGALCVRSADHLYALGKK